MPIFNPLRHSIARVFRHSGPKMEVLTQPPPAMEAPSPLDFKYPLISPDIVKGKNGEGCSTEESSIIGSVYEIDEPGCEGPRVYPVPPEPRTDNTVLPEDLKTPDSHVVRDPRLIRLTGIHPFNVEAPLPALYDEGFLTTKDLHYVRNHGPVPVVEDQDIFSWEFTVEGLVDNPMKLTLRDLIYDFEQVIYPVTLVCAGNRRKEQNVVRKTKGFSWGPAGLSTALWTGVALGDVLRRAGPKRTAKYVYFEGDEKLPNGPYGTSEKLSWCMNPDKGFMLSYKMNGEILHPDHGKPLRVVIPGQIGGRSVKWLRKIILIDAPSDNWYHIYDNRVLPTMITPEESANLPKTWKDERYAIYDLNTNSATAYPAHGETVSLTNGRDAYRVRGYAYAGGGKRVTRVELTLDKGKSWQLADINYPEDAYRLAPEGEMLYGGRMDMAWRDTCFCWCFWELEVPMSALEEADDIMVRAMDEAMMVQPRDMYWSVLGMMNNPWYRIAIHKDGRSLRFEHPTQPALMPGGWMERVKASGGNITNGFWGEKVPGEEEAAEPEEPAREISMINKDVDRVITIDEFREHGGEDEPWFVVHGQVYDGTKFLEGHPGGPASIFGAAGQDATEEFMAIHSENAKEMMPDYHIGTLDEAAKKALSSGEAEVVSSEPRAVFLQAKKWTKAVISAKKKISADTKIFTFDLEHQEQEIGLPVGQHLMMRLRDPATREPILRAYTPVSEVAERGKLDVLVKIYRDSPEGKGGKMTQALDSLPIGHTVDFRGPVGKFEYLEKGLCRISGHERRVNRFVMIAAGSGITPIYQVLRAVANDPEDRTRCLLLDGNRVEGDILLRDELHALTATANAKGADGSEEDLCRAVYTLSRPSAAWTGLRGRMGRKLLESEIGACREVGGSDLVLICGPKAMEKAVHVILKSMGWVDDDLVFF